MFEKIEIERAENGYIIYVDKKSSRVFTNDRALIKELRSILKEETIIEGAQK